MRGRDDSPTDHGIIAASGVVQTADRFAVHLYLLNDGGVGLTVFVVVLVKVIRHQGGQRPYRGWEGLLTTVTRVMRAGLVE
jgi:hypothetical protein